MKQTATDRSKKIYVGNAPAVLIAFYLLIVAAPAKAQTDGSALNFDGSDDYVTIAHSSALSPTNVTLECWVNPSRGSVASGIITKAPNDGSHIGYGFIQRSNNTFGFVIGNESSGDMVTSVAFTPGNWYHLAGTFNGSTIKLYVNGVLQGSVNSSLSINSANNITIGNNTSLSQSFQGSIDEVRIWNTAKCQGEIQYKMYCQLAGSQSDLVANYTFNQGIGFGINSSVGALADASGNGFNGTLNNFALIGRTSNWVTGIVAGSCGTWTAPTATITTGGSTTVCQGLPVALTANSGTGYTYQWLRNGAAVSGATAQTYAATASGSYVVTVGGNCSTSSATSVTVIPLTITAPADVTAYANSGCSATGVSLGRPATGGSCYTGNVSNDYHYSYFPVGVTTVNWTVRNASGATATATQTVTVIDNVDPTITAPSNVIAYTNSGCSATGVSLGTPATDDNCSVASVTNDHVSTTFPFGTTTVTWTVTDASGNASAAMQTVTVIDNINPTITAPADITVYTNSGCSATGISIGSPSTGDNCSVASVTNDHPSTTFPLGSTAVSWVVTDASGNFATAVQTVTVIDNVSPTITAPASVTAYTNSGCSATGVSLGTPATDDNCSVASITNDHESTTFPLGTTTVNWTVTDASGNTATVAQTVTVIDNVNPTITAPSNVTVNSATGTNGATVSVGSPETADNCSVASVTNNHPSSSYPVGTTTITWTVTDGSGNTSSANQTITVNDAEGPHAVARNYTLNLSGGTGTVTAEDINNGSYDNCGIASMTVRPNVFTCSQSGNRTVTLTVTDIHGNVSTCTSVVTVQYNPASTVTVTPASGAYTGGVANNIYLGYGPQSAVLAVTATGGSGFTYSWSPATALSSTTAANPTFCPRSSGSYTYTVRATNSNGCSVSKNVSMYVVDAVDHSHSGKVLLCHTPQGCHANPQLLSISANAVAAHLSEHSGDRLGTCSGGCHTGARQESLTEASSVPEATQVFPNPSNGTFTIVIPATRTDAVIVITDFTGRVLDTRSISENTGSPIEFTLSDATPGMYFVKVNAGEFSHIEKMAIR